MSALTYLKATRDLSGYSVATANLQIYNVEIDGKEVDDGGCERDIVYISDKGGNKLKLQQYEGKLFSPYYKPADLQKIHTLPLRNDDIYFPAFPRTGTHWTFKMVSMLLKGKAKTIRKAKLGHQLEIASGKELNSLPSPRVLCAHMCLSEAPLQLVEKSCKLIYNLRDPKDVAVSFYHMCRDIPDVYAYSGRFEDFLYLFLEGKIEYVSIFDHYRDAEKFFEEHPSIPVHFQIYEDTHKDPLTAVQKLSDFLGLPRQDDLCKAIAEKCEFSKMLEDKSGFTIRFGETNPLYRKGIVGDWRNYFTEEMLEDYYRVYEEKMAGSRFYDRYSRDKYT